MSTSDKVTKFDNLIRSLNKIIFGNENEDVTLDGATRPTWSKWLKSKSLIIDNKADKSYVDNALSQFQSGSSKFYATLADANADIANIMPKLTADTVKGLVNVGEVANGGIWYKADSSATSLTKSPYDSLTQSQKYVNSTLAESYVKNYLTETALKASLPTVPEMRARADDTRKIWRWNRTSVEGATPVTGTWTDTRLSDLDQAMGVINEKFKKSGDVANLFEFEDVVGETAVVITQDGDVKNNNYSLNTLGASIDEIGNKFEAIDGESDSPTAYQFTDTDGNVLSEIGNDGDYRFGGQSLKALIPKEYKCTSLQPNEYMSDDFSSVYAKASIINKKGDIPPFVGAYKQDFEFNALEFLQLKIQEIGNPLPIETPALDASAITTPHSQVVHPYLCSFKTTVSGYEHILIANPFNWSNDQFENPVIYGSNDLENFDMLRDFPQPLALPLNIPNINYNSDSFAVYDHTTSEFCCYYRNSILNESGKAFVKHNLYLRKTRDLKTWTQSKVIMDDSGEELRGKLYSPSIVYCPTLKKWVMYCVEDEFGYRTSSYLHKGWSEFTPIQTPAYMSPWHQETKYVGKYLVALIHDMNFNSGAGALFFGVSVDDGATWQFSENIFDGVHQPPYKATFSGVLVEDELKVKVIWSTNGNYPRDGWKLFSTETTQSIKVI